ncbi:hypothetical protein M8C15_03000 [Bacillus amyloliquefaciens]
MIESPPSVKKLSLTPIWSRPSTSCQMSESSVSISVSGALYAALPASMSGAGRDFLSIFPFAVTGSSSISTQNAGTM